MLTGISACTEGPVPSEKREGGGWRQLLAPQVCPPGNTRSQGQRRFWSRGSGPVGLQQPPGSPLGSLSGRTVWLRVGHGGPPSRFRSARARPPPISLTLHRPGRCLVPPPMRGGTPTLWEASLFSSAAELDPRVRAGLARRGEWWGAGLGGEGVCEDVGFLHVKKRTQNHPAKAAVPAVGTNPSCRGGSGVWFLIFLPHAACNGGRGTLLNGDAGAFPETGTNGPG